MKFTVRFSDYDEKISDISDIKEFLDRLDEMGNLHFLLSFRNYSADDKAYFYINLIKCNMVEFIEYFKSKYPSSEVIGNTVSIDIFDFTMLKLFYQK